MAGGYNCSIDYQSIHLLNSFLFIIDPVYDTMLNNSFIEVFFEKRHYTCTHWVYNLVDDICIKRGNTEIVFI